MEALPICSGCGSTENLEVHHVIPRCEGGTDGETVVLCRSCHVDLHNSRGDFKRWKEEGLSALFEDFGEIEARKLLSDWGRRGAIVTNQRHADKVPAWRRKGGESLLRKRGPEYFRQIGAKGGRSTAKRKKGE